MYDNKFTYLMYDKSVGNNRCISNSLTKKITVEMVLESDYDYLTGVDAVNTFNTVFHDSGQQIENNLDSSLYKLFLFSYDANGATVRITILEINNDNIYKLVTSNKSIPNKDFLISTCNYHSIYSKMASGIEITNKNSSKDLIKLNVDDIVLTATTPNTDPTDPIEQQPSFTKLPLYMYQKKTIKWMLNKEYENKCVPYNKHDEIIIGDVVFSVQNKIFLLMEDREKIYFSGGALIDEVGLGKTYQMISLSLINQAKNIKYIQPTINKFVSKATLVVCPTQLINQWTNEINNVFNSKWNDLYT